MRPPRADAPSPARQPALARQAGPAPGSPALGVPRLLVGLALALLLICAFLRVYRLGSLPGINGDEAWLGVAVRRWMAVRAASLQTPTGNYINPFFLLSERLLLTLFAPCLALLRWPAAVWNLAGLLVFWLLYRRAGGRPLEALLATLTAACLPMQLCHARLGWDPAFVLVVAPLMLCAAMAVAEHGWRRKRWVALLAGASFVGVWVHMTMIAFVVLIVAGLWVVGVRRALAKRGAPRGWGLLRAGIVAGVLALSAVGSGAVLTRLAHRPLAPLLNSLGQTAWETVTHGELLGTELRAQATILSGQRAFEYLAGKSLGPAALGWSGVCLAVFVVGGIVLLAVSRRPSDWCVGAIALAAGPAVLALRGLFHLELAGNQRYVLWLVPLFAVVLARLATRLSGRRPVWPAAALVLLAAVNLGATGRDYFASVARLEHRATQHPTFWTGVEEPKAAAARAITALSVRGPVTGVWTEDWWICHPLRFLLAEGLPVHNCWDEQPPAVLPSTGSVVLAGWSNGPFIAAGLRRYAPPIAAIQRIDIPGGDGRPALTLLVARPAGR